MKNGSLLDRDFKRGQLPTGLPGRDGEPGRDGQPGRSALTPLQPGESESGAFSLGGPTTAAGQFHTTGVTFPIPLAKSLDGAHVVAVDGSASAGHCPAQGQAEAGYLCVYVNGRAAMTPLASDQIKDPTQASTGEPGADRRGFYLVAMSNAASSLAAVAGTWTVSGG